MNAPEESGDPLQHELHVALCDNDPAAVRTAIERGADPNGDSSSAATPLWFATFHGKPESLEALLACGATVPEDALEAMGSWEIDDYMVTDVEDDVRYYRVAEALLARGANPTVKADEGKSLVEYYDWSPSLHRLFTEAIAKWPNPPKGYGV